MQKRRTSANMYSDCTDWDYIATKWGYMTTIRMFTAIWRFEKRFPKLYTISKVRAYLERTYQTCRGTVTRMIIVDREKEK